MRNLMLGAVLLICCSALQLDGQEAEPFLLSYEQWFYRSFRHRGEPADRQLPIEVPFRRHQTRYYQTEAVTMLNRDTWQAHSGWWAITGSSITGFSRGDAYCTLLQEHPDDFRLTVTGRINRGLGLSVWFAGSKKGVEQDGYFFSLHTHYAKLQRRVQDVVPKRYEVTIKPRELHTITIERIGSEVRAYKDADPRPVYVWNDPRPLRGTGHRYLGLYVWNGEVEIFNYTVEAITAFRGPKQIKR